MRRSWLIASVLAHAAGCAPDLPHDPRPNCLELEFDPAAGRTSQPTSLVIDPETGLIDLSRAGIEVPHEAEQCAHQAELSVAQCEFYQYLERLDGFPTLAAATTPVSAAIDPETIRVGDDVAVFDLTQQASVDDVDVDYDADSGQLRIDPRAGWELGRSYLVGVRGYAGGVEGTDGAPACASIVYALLKSPRSLSCGASVAEQIDARCEYYGLFASDPRFAQLPPGERRTAIAENLLQLEQLRRYYRGETTGSDVDLWAALRRDADMSQDEVAIGWLFPVHTASVAELDPTRGLVPQIVGPDVIRIALRGSLDASTASAFSLEDPAGTVFLLNVDVLQQDPLDPRALPPFEVSYADGDVVLSATDPDNGFEPGATYALLLSDELSDENGAALVPSPVTVFLRSRGVLVDEEGRSQVAGVNDAQAAELERARLQFEALLDDPMIAAATISAARPTGLTREHIAYLYGFTFQADEQATQEDGAP